MGLIVVGFVYGLLHSSWRSAKEVEKGFNRPPPPPVWEKFPFLKRYHGGIRSLVPVQENVSEYPDKELDEQTIIDIGRQEAEKAASTGPGFNKRDVPASEVFDPINRWNAQALTKKECFLDANNTIRVPPSRVYRGVPSGQPDPVISSHNLLGIRDDICFERFGRLGPYGLGYSRKYGGSGAGMQGDREGIDSIWEDVDQVDYRGINWAEAQRRCQELNQDRFEPLTTNARRDLGGPEGPIAAEAKASNGTISNKLPRTVVLIRTWQGYEYDDEDIMYLRSLISELSLHSGAEYTIHFLIHVKDDSQIWSDEAIHAKVLNESLPLEFQGMGTLWSEPQMQLIYPGLHESNFRNLGVYGVYRSFWMPAMYFAHQHPEYDFYWNVEMDARYIGHWYELFSKTSSWAAAQPRKGLWERNGRFYIPAEHGSWEDFSHMVRVQTEHGTAGKANVWAGLAKDPNVPENIREEAAGVKAEKPIWGPEPPLDDETDSLVKITPPTSITADKNTWGVGEEADLITFFPMFDPHGTNWILAEDVTGYNTTRQFPPRRTAINTFGRLSKRLLLQMYHDTLHNHRTMSSEMWPATTCLHHGLKAVYAPHPVYIDRRWPTSYLASVLNGGRNGASGGSRMSVFSDERQHNFRGTTWYYDAGHAPNVWKRWLGYKVDNDGGEQEELAGEGRMCLRSMLLHPVKDVKMVVETSEFS